ncbi:MAG TPA: hypothetical protein DEQ09_09170 [Bacteroidales bacterium]|nr:hypothetical protein [Bacteroidales bacterium]
MRSKLILIILSLLMGLIAQAQDVVVKTEIDSSEIYIGDHTEYTVTIKQPSDISLKIPEYKDTLTGGIEIISQTVIDTLSEESGELVLKKKYTVTAFDSGYYHIPPYYLEYETGQGKKRYYSDYVLLKVKRVDITPPDSTDVIFDIIGPGKIGYSVGEILPWVLLVMFITIVSWLLYKYLPRRRKKEEVEGPPIPSEPIHIFIFRELDKLEKKKLWQNGKIKEYYSELTGILRYYIEIRYSIRALEMTSEEILEGMLKEQLDDELIKILRNLLQNADLSKFAKYKHDTETNESVMADTRHFVKLTYQEFETREAVNTGDEVNSDKKEVSDE